MATVVTLDTVAINPSIIVEFGFDIPKNPSLSDRHK